MKKKDRDYKVVTYRVKKRKEMWEGVKTVL